MIRGITMHGCYASEQQRDGQPVTRIIVVCKPGSK
jgi:hypothetical protein